MNEDEIRRIIEQQIPTDSDISQNNIEDIVAALKELEEKKVASTPITEDRINGLKTMMNEEQDWRKKASIAAKIISINLE